MAAEASRRLVGKLVRDRIPEIIQSKGETPVTKVITGEELKAELIKKLSEEQSELLEELSLGEIADMVEVLIGIAKILGFSEDDVIQAVHKKRNERGGFDEGVFLIEIIEAPKDL